MALDQTLTGEEAFQIASFGLVEDPQAPKHFRGYEGYVSYVHPYGVLNHATWGRVLNRNEDDVVEQTITDHVVTVMSHSPSAYAPANPYYRKTHVNAPGTVRSWFRKMRAADFETAVYGLSRDCGYGGNWWSRKPWDVLDTQTVVDRETAAHYLKPDPGSIYFVQGGRVLGKIDDIKWPWQRREWREPLRGLGLTDLSVDYHSNFPLLSSKVQSPARGITSQDLKRFIEDDDRRRHERRAAERRHAPCPKCNGVVRFAGAPVAYYGERQCQLLYHYSKLLEADRRYSSAQPEIWLCDECRIAGFL